MQAVYSTMEEEFATIAAAAVWARHGEVLRRAPSLERDLFDVEPAALSWPTTPATAAYVDRIRAAAADDPETGGAQMMGHLHVGKHE